MENKLTEVTPEDDSTIVELALDIIAMKHNALFEADYPISNREKRIPKNCNDMSSDIGNLIMSAVDLLYGSGDNGTGYSWRNLFWERYGEQNVEHLTPIGKPVAVTGYRNELKYSGINNYSCTARRIRVHRYTETFEAINLRIDAVEKILSKYSDECVTSERIRFGDDFKKIETT